MCMYINSCINLLRLLGLSSLSFIINYIHSSAQFINQLSTGLKSIALLTPTFTSIYTKLFDI